jgi:transcription initiation factor TFIIIB Brf1 subunit/transcription initiation factor TFIIB
LIFLNNEQCITVIKIVKWLSKEKISVIYKEFQSELELSLDTMEYSERLHQDLIEKDLFRYESPYLISAICIFAVSCLKGEPISLKEISDVSHIKESSLMECYDRVYDQIESSLKKL